MKQKHESLLKLLGKVNEDIIVRNSIKRYELMSGAKKARKKKFIPIIAIAAAVAILMSLAAVTLVPMMTKQVPIYTGMTVSSANTQSASADRLVPLSALIPLDNQNFEGNNGNHGSNNPNKKPHKDIEDIIEEPTTETPETTVLPDGTIEVIPNESLYYAKPNEDIFITIHFDNPDEYTIMSFRINGKPYASYMFEYGSDYENIIIKVNVGEVEGLIDYTIDAIQYADREELKYVEMKGDPTLTIGVATDNQPVAEITDEIIDINEMSFNVTVTDELELVSKTGGKLFAGITDGETIVAAQELAIGENSGL